MLSLLGAVILVWFLLANPLSILAQTPAVLDTTGQPIRSGTQYYILPSGSSSGGGGATLLNRNNSCPLFVGLEGRVGSVGLPVIFTSSSGEQTITESSGFTVRFDASTTCVQSTEWALETSPASTQRTLISTRVGNANRLYLRIDRDANGYKLVFCPPSVGRPRCGEVGVYVENGKRFLALYEQALPVMFRRA